MTCLVYICFETTEPHSSRELGERDWDPPGPYTSVWHCLHCFDMKCGSNWIHHGPTRWLYAHISMEVHAQTTTGKYRPSSQEICIYMTVCHIVGCAVQMPNHKVRRLQMHLPACHLRMKGCLYVCTHRLSSLTCKLCSHTLTHWHTHT